MLMNSTCWITSLCIITKLLYKFHTIVNFMYTIGVGFEPTYPYSVVLI